MKHTVLVETVQGSLIAFTFSETGMLTCEANPLDLESRLAHARISSSTTCRGGNLSVKDVKHFARKAAEHLCAHDLYNFIADKNASVFRSRLRIASAVCGDLLCEIDVNASWSISRVKGEIELLTGTAVAHQRLMTDNVEIRSNTELQSFLSESSATLRTLRLLKVSWASTLADDFPEIHTVSGDSGLLKRAGHVTQLLEAMWHQCSQSGPLPHVASTPDYLVAFKLEIAESWRQTREWGQILLFTANGIPEWEQYPFRCPNFVLQCFGEPRLLVVVSNHAEANHHISGNSLECTEYDLPTGVELSVILAVAGDGAAVYIDGREVCREWVGPRSAHERLEVLPNPPNEGWISMHGYEVPNEHVRIRELFYVSFPEA